MVAAIAVFAFTSTLTTPTDYLIVKPVMTNLTGQIDTGSKVLRMEDQIWLQEALGERYVRLRSLETGDEIRWWEGMEPEAVLYPLYAEGWTAANRRNMGKVYGIAAVERGIRNLSPTNKVEVPRYVMKEESKYTTPTVIYRGAESPSPEAMKMLVLTNVCRMAVVTDGMTNFNAAAGRPLKLQEVRGVFAAMKEYKYLAWSGRMNTTNKMEEVTQTISVGMDGTVDEFAYTNKYNMEQGWPYIWKGWSSSTFYHREDGELGQEKRYDEGRETISETEQKYVLPGIMAYKNHKDASGGSAIKEIDAYLVVCAYMNKSEKTGIDESETTNGYACIAIKVAPEEYGSQESPVTNGSARAQWRVSPPWGEIFDTARGVWNNEPSSGPKVLPEFGELEWNDLDDDVKSKDGWMSWSMYILWMDDVAIGTMENRTEMQ